MARLQSTRDTPNTAREYETIYILRPNTANDGVAEVNTRIKGVIESMGGKVIKVDNWGKRRLAYEVAKERKGIYLYWLYLAQPGVVEECERNLRMLDNVIRYLTVKVDENVDLGARPSEIDETSYDKAAQTAADEEDLFLSRGGDDGASDRDDEEEGDVYADYTGVEKAAKADKEADKEADKADKEPAAAEEKE
ncbi:MAG TPA: 30S ribosomal protein S6 [Kofleriaceae bacterium]|jgi:small subunit ribosomal protein S6